MNKHWYLITGKLDEIMIVKSTEEKIDDIAEEYVEHLEYQIYSIDSAEQAIDMLSKRSNEPPYFIEFKVDRK